MGHTMNRSGLRFNRSLSYVIVLRFGTEVVNSSRPRNAPATPHSYEQTFMLFRPIIDGMHNGFRSALVMSSTTPEEALYPVRGAVPSALQSVSNSKCGRLTPDSSECRASNVKSARFRQAWRKLGVTKICPGPARSSPSLDARFTSSPK